MISLSTYAQELGENARAASRSLRAFSVKQRNRALTALAANIKRDAGKILTANSKDVEEGKAQGLSSAMIDRLLLNPKRLQGVIDSVKLIARLPDPLGRTLSKLKRKD